MEVVLSALESILAHFGVDVVPDLNYGLHPGTEPLVLFDVVPFWLS